jgi:hypothetical protein
MTHYMIRRIIAAAVLTASLAVADTIGEDVGTNVRPIAMNAASHASAAQNVTTEIAAIGIVGSAAWLVGLGLRRRAFGAQSKSTADSVNG